MNLKKLFLTKNNCYTAARPLNVRGIMVHSTGANNPALKRYVGPDDGLLGVNKYNNHWNTSKPDGRSVCVHAFIGKLENGAIATYQTLPWNMRGWHGGGSSNDTHIGFEICEDGLTDSGYFSAVYFEAVELCAFLCKEYNLNPLAKNVVICHSEGYKIGIASNHGDVMHWFPKFGKTMDTFRADVNALLNKGDIVPQPQSGEVYRVRKTFADGASQVGAYKELDNAKKIADERSAEGYKVFDKSGTLVYDPALEIAVDETVANGISDGVLTDKNYWLNALSGKTAAKPEYIKTVFDRYHKKLNDLAVSK